MTNGFFPCAKDVLVIAADGLANAASCLQRLGQVAPDNRKRQEHKSLFP